MILGNDESNSEETTEDMLGNDDLPKGNDRNCVKRDDLYS